MTGGRIGLALRDLGRAFDDGIVAGLEDGELLERFASRGDGAAFEAIVARHGPMVLATCRGVLRDRHAAEDAFQATFLTLARKAGSLRSGGALAGWLHRVARRVAIQADADIARRRKCEAWSPALDAAEARPGPPSDDPRPVLHEEIDRLPEHYRAAIVLCYLEGLTHEQAAGHLRCPVGTVGSRVVRGRELMRARLLRRGLVGAGAAIASAPIAASASVPEGWARAAVAAAIGGSASNGALTLSRTILKGMLMSKLKIAAFAGLVTMSLLATGVLAIGPGSTDPGAEATPRPSPAARDGTGPGSADPPTGAEVAIIGQVLDLAGKPVEGARLRVDFFAPEAPEGPAPAATSGIDGRFSLRVARAAFDRFAEGYGKRAPRVVASASGFGPAWASPGSRSDALREVTLRLAPDDLPIRGRVVDLEGRPIAGVAIRSTTAWEPPGGDLSPWIEGARKRGQSAWEGLESIPLERSATTGPDGRFFLDGIGRERLVDLAISGPTIEAASAYAMTRNMPSFRPEAGNAMAPESIIYHGATFEHAAAPTRPIFGVVRDKDTGKPMAGVRVQGMVHVEGSLALREPVNTVTDDEGRYRLIGLAGAAHYRVLAFPAKGQPYPNATVAAAGSAPLFEPLACDIALKRGVIVRGRATDKATGKPIRASIESFAFGDNPHVAGFPGFRSSYPPRAETDADGRFAVVALPGRGIITARSGSESYLDGIGAEAISGRDGPYFLTEPYFCNPTNYQVLAEISPGPGAVEVMRDLEFDPGRTIQGTAQDPGGRPIAGTVGSGLAAIGFWGDRTLELPDFEVTGVDRRRPRRLYLWHEGRKLAGSALLLGDEAGPLVVRLLPSGVVTGRIVDEEGRPRTKLELMDTAPPAFNPDRGFMKGRTAVDAEGRFRVEGLVPGLKYEAHALERNIQIIGKIFDGLRLEPGETKDLGDVVVAKPSPG